MHLAGHRRCQPQPAVPRCALSASSQPKPCMSTEGRSWAILAIQTVCLHVTHYAHDFRHAPRDLIDRNMPANGAAARPEAPRQRLVDYNHSRRLLRIRIGRGASRQQGNPQRAEVRGRAVTDRKSPMGRCSTLWSSSTANCEPNKAGQGQIVYRLTPGDRAAWRSIRQLPKNAIRWPGAVLRPPPNGTRTVRTPDGRNPGSIASRMNLNQQAGADQHHNASATSVTTRGIARGVPRVRQCPAAPCASGTPAQAASPAPCRRRPCRTESLVVNEIASANPGTAGVRSPPATTAGTLAGPGMRQKRDCPCRQTIRSPNTPPPMGQQE